MASPCCPADSTSPLDHTPPFVGQVVDITGDDGTAVKTYVTGDAQHLSACTHIVVVLSDVFGYDSGRHFEFADRIATLLNGKSDVKAAVLVPDVFSGRPLMVAYRFLPEFFSGLISLPSFVYRVRIQGTKQFLSPIYDTLLPWVEKQGVDLNSSTISLPWVGFCFGGWLGCKCIAYSREANDNETPTPRWTCGIGIHPSLIPERAGGGSEEELASSLGDTPLLLMPASNDGYHPNTGDEVLHILSSNRSILEEDISVPFPDVKHGFCSRGDSSNETVLEAQRKAEALAAEFILKHSQLTP